MKARMSPESFRPCSTCKKPIALAQLYYVCSVSTCTGQRTGFVFCSVDCWDAHVPTMRHKEAWAEERTAPRSRDVEAAPPRQIDMRATPPKSLPRDILIVASKLKTYIRARGDMNTAADVMEALSDRMRALCDAAIDRARRDGRKTVLARDVP